MFRLGVPADVHLEGCCLPGSSLLLSPVGGLVHRLLVTLVSGLRSSDQPEDHRV